MLLSPVLRKIRFNTLEELYAAIGYDGLTAQKSVNRVKGDDCWPHQGGEGPGRAHGRRRSGLSRHLGPPRARQGHQERVGHRGGGAGQLSGQVRQMLHPRADRTGFITRGFGVSVHRTRLPQRQRGEALRGRAGAAGSSVAWVGTQTPNAVYQTSLELSAKDRDGLALDVTMALSTVKVKVNSFSARSQPDGTPPWPFPPSR